MNDIQHEHDMNRDSDKHPAHKEQRPYWKRVHHDWRFWVALFSVAPQEAWFTTTSPLVQQSTPPMIMEYSPYE